MRRIIVKIINSIKWHAVVDVREMLNTLFSKRRRAGLAGDGFTIISNNCWAGHVYRYFGLPYNTPTIGLYIWPECYLQLLSDLKTYMGLPLTFIGWEESMHPDILQRRGETDKPIGRLGDVEIVFLHYESEEEVLGKWTRRVQRIDWNHILVKCSQQNGMTWSQVEQFDRLPYDDKIIFVPISTDTIKSAVWYKNSAGKDEVEDDILSFRKYVDLTSWINGSYTK